MCENFGTLFIRLNSIDECKCEAIISELNDKQFPKFGSNNKIIVKKISKEKCSTINSELNESVKETKFENANRVVGEISEGKDFRCVICLQKDKNVIFLPCAHLASCVECSLALKNCPLCRKNVEASIRTFT